MPASLLLYNKSSIAAIIFCWCLVSFSYAQDSLVYNSYALHIKISDKDSSLLLQQFKFQTTFSTSEQLMMYVQKVPAQLALKGYPVASVDSVVTMGSATFIDLYVGKKYSFVDLRTNNIEQSAWEDIGYVNKPGTNKPLNFTQLQALQNKLLSYYEKTGYPFAAVYLDSIFIQDEKISATLQADKSVLYHVDSIRVMGKVNLKKKFLQRYLNILNGSVYNKNTLNVVDKRISELTYVTQIQPSDVTMLGNGSVLNLYLATKPSSQVNFLVGFLPGSGDDNKLQLTGDVNLDLKNMLGGGEAILIKWQQLQRKSPRLNLGFNQPYIFNSAYGLDFLFDLFKKDSSFLQVNAQLGIQYSFSALQTGTFFLQLQNTSLLSGGIDTNAIKTLKRLPDNIDVKSVNAGLNYTYINTNYRLNPRMGNEISGMASVGIKNIKQNNEITGIKDPSFNFISLYDSLKKRSYQLRLRTYGAHYFPITKYTTIKASLSGGAVFSPNIFRNELYQIGGYKLLRGFDEESIYASRYLVGSAEYRLLVNTNSYLFFFADGAVVQNKYQYVNVKNNFISTGLGLLFETKLGLLNISFAVGKRDDVKFNLSQSTKLHFGYINYF